MEKSLEGLLVCVNGAPLNGRFVCEEEISMLDSAAFGVRMALLGRRQQIMCSLAAIVAASGTPNSLVKKLDPYAFCN
ncbi:hypothetical protein NC653_029814 [Populus alba x Populus x berolinensis]|uniref:Uncharacterized protein n=1 Tax=Populus alba x Populus x berolinensis TaxID=444605 RepID=A0AAD6M324_9ROSI|nr:hypothetical protein NC653_029811 [Populus alba x Populus x berolinensis]KAJ6978028.1 hypothetical protein NC653_029814 [Populus alba x Populus x berolinensis]